MADADGITEDLQRRAAVLGTADMIVALTAPSFGEDGGRRALERVTTALTQLAPGVRTVVIHSATALPPGELGAADGPVRLFPFPGGVPDQAPRLGLDAGQTYRSVFAVHTALGARTCVVIGSDPGELAPQALRALVQPVLEGRADLVTPFYRRGRYDGLLTSSVVAPLFRALYGARLHFPIGGDFGLSGSLVARCLPVSGSVRRDPVWFASEAACAGLGLAQAHLGVPFPTQREPTEASAVLGAVLGPVFQDLEHRAPCWQRIRGSRSVATLGTPAPLRSDTAAPDTTRMVESFRIGYANLQDVWRVLLPPATLLELKRLTQLPPDAFRMSDELWARIVFDFALGYRLRMISREHVLGALTPAYLAWVASYVREAKSAGEPALAGMLERIGAAYEAQKPYLVSRWRWPDRFNP
jgi:hypothetical protein